MTSYLTFIDYVTVKSTYKTSKWYSETNSLQNVYLGFFIFENVMKRHRFATYLWNDPRIFNNCNTICADYAHLQVNVLVQ